VTPQRVSRLVALTWWLHLKMMNRSAFDGLLQVVWPLFFATAALLIYRTEGNKQSLVYAALGASVMTIWTAISSSGSGILQRERSFGTLELVVASPTPFSLSVMSIVLAVSTVGGYGMVATLLWARLAFGIETEPAQPLLFMVAVTVTVLSFAVLGFLLSVTVVRYRAAWALGGLLEYPVWLACGFLVPTALLPGWMRPVSWLLPPSWGMGAIRKTVIGAPPWMELSICAGLAAMYGVIGVRLAGAILRSARRNATLSLT